MPTSYEAAVAELYRAALDAFVAERKRLSAELKGGGDKAGAARLAKLGRPTVSAWAVNQLFWRARGAFDELFATAQRLREGDLDATGAHREAVGVLRERAAAILGDAGHAASDGTLRRITTTLSALAASGGFDPDPPGALARDRDPPGFEAAELAPMPAVQTDTARERAAAEAERRRIEEERKQRAERERLEAAVDKAKRDVEARLRDVDRLRRELAEAEARLERARTVANELDARLNAFERLD